MSEVYNTDNEEEYSNLQHTRAAENEDCKTEKDSAESNIQKAHREA